MSLKLLSEQLPAIGGHSTFRSEFAFVHTDTGRILKNPIWDTLRDSNRFHLIVRQCFSQAEHKGQLKRIAKAIRVPPTRTAGAPPCLYTHVDVRHVQVEAGIHTIGEAAWQRCNKLLIVHPPSSSLPERWRVPSKLCTPYGHGPRVQKFWELGVRGMLRPS